jgi:tungstate transport system ATP-binding protein
VIEIVNLNQSYGQRQVLKDINLKIEKGEVLALIGPTGAGKTTLLRLLDMLESPASGSVRFGGRDVTRSRRYQLEVRRRISFVQQKPVVFNMNVSDNVALGLRWRHEKSWLVKQKVADALEQVALIGYESQNARTLSGGEAQRVAIARALVIRPEVLLLDEPSANLDPISASKIDQVLTGIIAERRTTIVMATHDLSQGQHLADRIAVLMNGQLLQVGGPDDIFSSPRSLEVAEFVGVCNILEGMVVAKDGNMASVKIDGTVVQTLSDYAPGEMVYVLVRPEDVTLALSQDKTSARNTFKGRITKLALVGPLVRIELDCGFPLFVVVTRQSAQGLGLAVGEEVYASFKATATRAVQRWT